MLVKKWDKKIADSPCLFVVADVPNDVSDFHNFNDLLIC